MRDGDGSLRLEFGPLEPGTPTEALDPSTGGTATADRAEVRRGEGGDYLVLTVAARA